MVLGATESSVVTLAQLYGPIAARMKHYDCLMPALACALAVAGCSSNPCSTLHVVQSTDRRREVDVELDDGHVYAAPFDPNDLFGIHLPQLYAGDEVTLCVLTSTDGSKDYSLRVGGLTVKPTLVR